MDTPAVAKRPHEDGDETPDSKRVKGSEDTAMADVQLGERTQTASTSAPEAGPSPISAEKSGEKVKNKRRDASGFPKSRRGKDKDMKNAGRRKRQTRNDEALEQGSVDPDARPSGEPKAPRLPKRMCALLIGFCGSGYRGMQIQSGGNTIENTLFDAMVRAGAVSEDNADDPVKVNFARAARTDAGVHAAGNVVSLKMITQVPGVPDMTARINEELPPGIRLWEYIRVQNSFNPRTLCDSRKYTYFFPSYLLLPPKPTSALYRVLTEHAASLSLPSPLEGHLFWADLGDVADAPATAPTADADAQAADMQRKRAWRVSAAQMEQLRASAQKYVATHNFHNFTVDGVFADRSFQRVMKDIVIADPVVYSETEWISVLFHGQSFMMHQVRKMIAALVLACRTGTPPQIIDELYGPRAIMIPKMPALGLLLEQPIFDSYNTKIGYTNAKLPAPAPPNESAPHPDFRAPIDFSVHREKMEAFKERYIYDNMRLVEERDGLCVFCLVSLFVLANDCCQLRSFDAWIRMVDAYAGTDLLYLNPKGTIPPAAVIINRNSRGRKGAFVEEKLFNATSFPVPGQAEATAGGAAQEGDAGEEESGGGVETEG
ncbi:pseudouridine synthase [Mycena alexandri]|uniref:tRNA pseudouridine synthase 1 n=1 Tax=Mycena alexandri TaxID=1745969 RepID=A0AAD6S813_9AGAR|nr:pseudouridine synthase [Mycena alexandri]